MSSGRAGRLGRACRGRPPSRRPEGGGRAGNRRWRRRTSRARTSRSSTPVMKPLPACSRMVTTPLLPSTRMRSPVFTRCVPFRGHDRGQLVLARDDGGVRHDAAASETAAAMRAKTMDQLGAVSGQTRISPSSSSASSPTLWTTRAMPSARPGEAARPLNSSGTGHRHRPPASG